MTGDWQVWFHPYPVCEMRYGHDLRGAPRRFAGGQGALGWIDSCDSMSAMEEKPSAGEAKQLLCSVYLAKGDARVARINWGKCGEMRGNAAMPKANRSLGNTQYGAISSWCNILIQNIICVLGFVSQYYVSRHQFIFSPTWAFKLVAEVHALCYGRYMLCPSLKALGFPHGKPPLQCRMYWINPQKAALTSRTCPGCCRYGWRCCSTVSEAARSTRGGDSFDDFAPIIKMWDPWWEALTFFTWGYEISAASKLWSTEVQGDRCQASTLSGPLVHLTLWGDVGLLPKIGTPKNDIKLFFHVHSYSTIVGLQA